MANELPVVELAKQKLREFVIAPNTEDERLSVPVNGRDHLGQSVETTWLRKSPSHFFSTARSSLR